MVGRFLNFLLQNCQCWIINLLIKILTHVSLVRIYMQHNSAPFFNSIWCLILPKTVKMVKHIISEVNLKNNFVVIFEIVHKNKKLFSVNFAIYYVF